MKRTVSAILTAGLFFLLLVTAGEGRAETITKRDPQPRCSQSPPLDVRSATFTYRENIFKVRVRMKDLSKRKTQVITRYVLGSRVEDRWGVMLVTKYVNGERKTFGRWADYEHGDFGRFGRGVEADWDWARSIITFKLTSYLRGRRIFAAAYSVPKGADHGPPCGDHIAVQGLSRG